MGLKIFFGSLVHWFPAEISNIKSFPFLGEADPAVQERSGDKSYNMKLTMLYKKSVEFSDLGILYDMGRRCCMKGMAGVASLEKITEEQMEEIMNDCDPIDAPPGSYTVQPDNQGEGGVKKELCDGNYHASLWLRAP